MERRFRCRWVSSRSDLATALGVLLGLWAGYWGGWIDNLIMRVMDGVYAFPTLVFAIAIVAVLGANLFNAKCLAIGIAAAPRFARSSAVRSFLSAKADSWLPRTAWAPPIFAYSSATFFRTRWASSLSKHR